MKSLQYGIALLVSAACLVMSLATVVTNRSNAQRQALLQQAASAIQNDYRTVAGTEQISRNILTDLGNAAITNTDIRAMLEKHGYQLTQNQNPAAAQPAVNVAPEAPVAAPVAPAIQPAPSDPVAPVVPASVGSAPKASTPAVSAPKAEVITPPVTVPAAAPEATPAKEEKKP